MDAITPNTTIAQIVSQYPKLADILIKEYGFHCVNCFASEFETLEEGAAVHGITGEYLQELIKELNAYRADL